MVYSYATVPIQYNYYHCCYDDYSDYYNIAMLLSLLYSYVICYTIMIAMLLCTGRGPRPSKVVWHGQVSAEYGQQCIRSGYNLDTAWIHGGRSGPLGRPFSRSCVGSPCSMACSIAGAESAKNAHIWPFSGVLAYVNASIIVPSCAGLGRSDGPDGPDGLPGWYFFHRRPPHVSPHSPIFGQNLIDGCVPYADNSPASHKNGSIFGFHLITSIIPLSHRENGF